MSMIKIYFCLICKIIFMLYNIVMNKFQSKEDYLESILKLSKIKEDVHAIDIARDLNFSKPSVSIALKKLKESNLILVDQNSDCIFLTDEGKKIAMRVYERHLTIKKWFMALGVKESVAEKDACNIEHELSEETYQALKNHIKDKIN